MLDCHREELLFHPLTRQIVRMKWRKIGLTVFFLGALLYALFLSVFSHYLFCCSCSFQSNTAMCINDASSHCSKDLMVPQEYIIAIFCFINLLFEGYQLYNERWMYLDVSNFLEVSTYVTAIATVLPLNGGIAGESDVQWATGVISLLLAFGVMLVQLQLLFCSGIYVTMLIEVLKSVFRVIVVFSVLFLAYGLIFYLLLGDELSYQNTYMSTLKVFDMMAGGIEFNHYFVEKSIPMPDLARFIVFTFIIVMSLSFMNLLVVAALQERAVQWSGQKHGIDRGPHPASSEFQIKVIQVATLLGRTTTHKNSFTNASFQYHIAEDGAAFPKDDTREYLKSSWNKADIQPANKPSA
ncbi:PREDICTED: transient receptor potential cation channel subfamily A member 1-like [Acropora digitifera]|uniref:transient receptor potential cation channel subfamily A member 1-like n=1 Tax=Acropora digitifera TaxID=70779 RepID=UPI00077A8159|nr:PREDICTED: transient receptor potential cation channel subfamily A member 1-like [Acropora digitifera]